MAGLNYSPINPNQPYTNGTGGHLGGFYDDTTIPNPPGSFHGTRSNVEAANRVPPVYGGNKILKGGRGYGMSLEQNAGFGFNKYTPISSYDNIGMKNELNLDASTQHSSSPLSSVNGGELVPYSKYMTGGKRRGGSNGKRGGKSHRYRGKGGANLSYYGVDNLNEGDASVFKGSYAPISVHNSQEGQLGGRSSSGGKKYRVRSRRARAGRSRGRTHRHNKYCKHMVSRRRSKRSMSLYRGKSKTKSRTRSRAGKLRNSLKMTKELLEKIVNGNIGEGKYQKGGMQEVSRGYALDTNITPQTSALANPMNFKSYDSCLEQPRV